MSFLAARQRGVARRRFFRPLCFEPLETRATPATFTVTSLTDVVNSADDATVLTLREAIIRANADNVADTIVFDPGLFTGPRTLGLTSAAVNGEQGLPSIAFDLTIIGPGAGLLTVTRQTGLLDFRLFTVNQNVRVAVSGMTFTNPTPASASSQFTGAIFNTGILTLDNVNLANNRANLIGAAIVNSGSGQLVLRNSTVSNNISDGRGGAIVNEGGMIIDRSTIAHNFSGAYGGGIHNEGTLTVTNSTIAQNAANQFGGGISNGDRDAFNNDGVMIAINATIVANQSDANNDNPTQDRGGGIWTERSQDTALDNTIVAGNFRGSFSSNVLDDLSGAIVQVGSAHNVIGDPATSGGMIDGLEGNILGFDPSAPDFNNADNLPLALEDIVVNRLANHGGPTDTYALSSTSPALNNGVTRFMVTPMRVISATGLDDLYPAVALIDSFGLDAIPTVENLATVHHSLANPVPDPNNPGNQRFPSWVTNSTFTDDYFNPASGTFNPRLTFFLGGTVNLSEMVVWGYTFLDAVTNPNGISNNEAKSFVVEFSLDGGLTYYDSRRVDQTTRSSQNNTRLPFNGIFPANVVRVTIGDNFFATSGATDGNRVGLGEIKFIGESPTIDQRGVARQPLPIDIGSFEGSQQIVITTGNFIVENVPGAIVGPVVVLNAPLDANFDFNVNDSRFGVIDNELRLGPTFSVSRATEPTITLEITARDGSLLLRQTIVLTVVANNFPWHNFALPEDANDDGLRNLQDALFIIRLLRRGEGGPLPPTRPPTSAGGHYGDVQPDNVLNVQDAIAVIRFLRRTGTTSQGEGEGGVPLLADSPSVPTPAARDLVFLALATEDARTKRPR
jgi:hypothetical protein